MKYEFYCAMYEDVGVINFLENKNIKYKMGPIPKRIYFTVYSDNEYCEELLSCIKSMPGTTIYKSSIFSKKEMEEANWYLLNVIRMGIETKNVEYTYEAKCRVPTMYGIQTSNHLDQINPFVTNRTPKWRSRYNFCTVDTGRRTKIFCSDFARNAIENSNINGIEFLPVLNKDLKTQRPDVSQLVFKNKLPLEAYTFIGDYREKVCSFCGRINYVFEEPRCDNIRLNIDAVPRGIDAFGSEILVGPGFGDELLVISKKFYNLLIKDLKENPNHFIIDPIG